MSNSHTDERTRAVKSANEARGARETGYMRWILGISTAAAGIIAMLWFFTFASA